MILDFNLNEERQAKALQEDFQAAVYIVAPAMRKGIYCGVQRAIDAIEIMPVDVLACRNMTAEQAWLEAQLRHLAALQDILT